MIKTKSKRKKKLISNQRELSYVRVNSIEKALFYKFKIPNYILKWKKKIEINNISLTPS